MSTDRVTLRDIYDRMDRFEDKLDVRFERLEKKVNSLETFRDSLKGQLLVIGGIWSTVVAVIVSWVKDKIERG